MAYVSQDMKAKLAPRIKQICKKYGIKATLAVRNHSVLVLNIKEGKVDFFADMTNQKNRESAEKFGIHVNQYWFQDHFDGDSYFFLKEVIPAMNLGNHDNSDIQTDYFDVGWYIDINVGKWNKPYAVLK